MSTQTFEDEFREALWVTYEQKCFIHGARIELNDMEIDHIVPESLLTSGNLHAQLAAYGLPNTFDIRGNENLIPTCRNCNSRKTNRTLPVKQAMIFLGQVQDKLPELEKEYQKNVSGVALGYLRVRAKSGVRSGKYTKAQLNAMLKDADLLEFSVNVPASSSKPSNPSVRFKKVKISAQAVEKVRDNIEVIDALDAVIFGLANGHVEIRIVQQLEKIFVCRLSQDSRLLFTMVDEDTLFILDIMTRRRG